MTSPDTTADGPGYWTIQIVQQDRDQIGGRYLCHAEGDRQAQSIALRLAGSARTTVGYNYHRIDPPQGMAGLAMGSSQSIDSPEVWSRICASAA